MAAFSLWAAAMRPEPVSSSTPRLVGTGGPTEALETSHAQHAGASPSLPGPGESDLPPSASLPSTWTSGVQTNDFGRTDSAEADPWAGTPWEGFCAEKHRNGCRVRCRPAGLWTNWIWCFGCGSPCRHTDRWHTGTSPAGPYAGAEWTPPIDGHSSIVDPPGLPGPDGAQPEIAPLQETEGSEELAPVPADPIETPAPMISPPIERSNTGPKDERPGTIERLLPPTNKLPLMEKPDTPSAAPREELEPRSEADSPGGDAEWMAPGHAEEGPSFPRSDDVAVETAEAASGENVGPMLVVCRRNPLRAERSESSADASKSGLVNPLRPPSGE